MTANDRADSRAVAVRPRVSGNPLDLASNPSLPKPKGQIEIVETGGGLTLVDRKLFNVLLALSWDKLGDARAPLPPFRASTAELRRAIGEPGERDNERLRQSFDRLMSTQVRFPYESTDGQLKDAAVPLLSFRALPKGSGFAEWEFPGKLRPMLAEPGIWARIHLEVCAKFGSKYGLILYELLSVRANLRDPRWDVKIEDFRALLGLAAGKLENFAHLERRVLAPAIREVNEFSGLTVAFEIKRSAGRGRRVEGLVFAIGKKSLAELTDVARLAEFAREPVGKGAPSVRDPRTPDLADGRTDAERAGGLPDAALALAARVSASVRDQARTEFPGVDVDEMLSEWSSWAAGQAKAPRSPSSAFLGFLRRKAKAGELPPTEHDAAGVQPAALAPAAGMPELERRATAWLGGQPFDVRRRWYARARQLGADDIRAAEAPQNVVRWVGAVTPELKSRGLIS